MDKYEAEYEAAMDVWEGNVQRFLRPRVDAEYARVENLAYEIRENGDQPHPWTRRRHFLWVWETDGEDGLIEELEEFFRSEAEEGAREEARESGPCCNDYHCPCGNNNNVPPGTGAALRRYAKWTRGSF
jgi:hypothetical protein